MCFHGQKVNRNVARFFGLTGMYQSLRYLTLNDATALGFLSPTTTALLGAMVLKEPFTRREMIAGSTSHPFALSRPTLISRSPQWSPYSASS